MALLRLRIDNVNRYSRTLLHFTLYNDTLEVGYIVYELFSR